MHMERGTRWVLRGLWPTCLVIAVWFVVAVVFLLLDDSPLNQLQNLGPLARTVR